MGDHNLPAQRMRLIGRERDLAAVSRTLDVNGRLVTLTGTGGCAKTSMALEVGSRVLPALRDGVWLIELAPLTNPALVPHVIDECARLADAVLNGCPEVRVLATSRESLRLRGELTWRVPSLDLPLARTGLPDDEDRSRYSAVQLFVERAWEAQPEFAVTENALTIARICARLGGLPLAIELAPARLRLLGPGELLARLDDAIGLLTDGA